MRIAVIGAGTAGLTTAWLLSPDHDVTVHEAEAQPGGVVRTHVLDTDRGPVPLDLGAQHLSPADFVAHRALRRLVGIDEDEEMTVPLTLTVTAADMKPLLVTPDAAHDAEHGRTPVTGTAWEQIGAFLTAAAGQRPRSDPDDGSGESVAAPLPSEATVAQAATAAGVDTEVRDQILLPWLASYTGCRLADAAVMPARYAAAWALRTPPGRPEDAALWTNLSGSLYTLTARLAKALGTRLRLSDPVSRISANGPGGSAPLTVHTTGGDAPLYDRVIVATPAWAAARMLTQDPVLAERAVLLNRLPYEPVTVALHRDARYMPPERRHWSAVTVHAHDGRGEPTYWFPAAGGPDVFKSWITHREEPADVLRIAHFRLQVLTVDAMAVRRKLHDLRLSPHLQLAGSYLYDIDSQESAVRSALSAAESIDASADRPARLRAALKTEALS
ncbi:FAD-dependent oxidoreductase [Streptomyces sp. AC536]|uniref:FAD-dependent oxidoreductase n=1 Tax=Streptomyces buecherae TaxID=2763006 RepID=UPI00164CF8D0|nr:FAD-dependent oxidoreductase [Streptomyces buecherae]MBC3986790.1 FAD-dependent oxidoreductase [Streptomyces buecherae]QNJ38985.1 FAD-dependent oxidoreductase [Streptomyces buecherae]